MQPDRWYTGVCPDGRQLLAVYDDTNAVICWLDGDGRHQGAEVVPHGLPGRPGAYWQRDDTYALEAWGNTFFIDSRDGQCNAS